MGQLEKGSAHKEKGELLATNRTLRSLSLTQREVARTRAPERGRKESPRGGRREEPRMSTSGPVYCPMIVPREGNEAMSYQWASASMQR